MSAISPEGVAYDDWIGRVSRRADILSARLAAEFEATFAPHLAPVPGAALGLFGSAFICRRCRSRDGCGRAAS